ncbi:MAG: Peroxiredoxin [Bacteroidota bacterium]|nr:Peroxiredoxin [Bacteroidota bacterium]
MVISLLFFVSVNAQNARSIKLGYWDGILTLHEKQSEFGLVELPVNFMIRTLDKKIIVEFINAKEHIKADEVSLQGDSLFIKMPVFDSEFKIKMVDDSSMSGVWINHGRKDKNVIGFRAINSPTELKAPPFVSDEHMVGKWEVTFSPQKPDNSKAIGIFKVFKNMMTGTFLTETGDYRFLSGGSSLLKEKPGIKLFCFDGAHAFLFTGVIKGDSIINGHFYSGAHHHEPWLAKRNDKFELRNPDSLTYLKTGYSKIGFSFKNSEGKQVSLSDEKFKNKVVLVQLMGTWCPNCMDETAFLAPFYDKYKTKGLEVVGLAFERTDDFNKAVSNINRTKQRFKANYEFLITMKTGNKQAEEVLPMLNSVMAFPTTIYIDKKGNVRKIYTGFNGPATGQAYSKYVEETTRFVEKLLME